MMTKKKSENTETKESNPTMTTTQAVPEKVKDSANVEALAKDIPVIEKKSWIEERRERYHKPIRIRFTYTENPGQSMPFVWQEFKGDALRSWELKDGERYTLPLGAVLILLQQQYYRGDIKMETIDGQQVLHQGKLEQRYSIDIYDYITDEEYERAEFLAKTDCIISTAI
jgi:hypothetical protein